MCNINNLPEEEMKIKTMKFAEILPSTLEYLDLVDKWLKKLGGNQITNNHFTDINLHQQSFY